MDLNKAVIQALLQLGIKLLGLAIPWLGTLLGGPLGWLAGFAISWLSGLVYDLVARYARLKAVDAAVEKQVADAKTATDALKLVQSNAQATAQEREKALADFKAAVRALTKFDGLHKDSN